MFVDSIIENNNHIDTELLNYLNQVELKQKEMTKWVQGLNSINQLDKIDEQDETISIIKYLEDIYETFYAETQASSLYFNVQIPKEEVFIVAQRSKFDMLFENLIFNAMKATPQNGTISILAWQDNKTLLIQISDTGWGISKDELTHIFKRFYIGKGNEKTGSSLGLDIVKNIVSEKKGHIFVKSKIGKGTTFTIELPILL